MPTKQKIFRMIAIIAAAVAGWTTVVVIGLGLFIYYDGVDDKTVYNTTSTERSGPHMATQPPESARPPCDNIDEVQRFSSPIHVVWKAKLLGCLDSCNGASFKLLSDELKYLYFAGYGSVVKDAIGGDKEGWLNDGMQVRIYGEWISIDEDHPRTVFDNKCVPVVFIDKIEKL